MAVLLAFSAAPPVLELLEAHLAIVVLIKHAEDRHQLARTDVDAQLLRERLWRARALLTRVRSSRGVACSGVARRAHRQLLLFEGARVVRVHALKRRAHRLLVCPARVLSHNPRVQLGHLARGVEGAGAVGDGDGATATGRSGRVSEE